MRAGDTLRYRPTGQTFVAFFVDGDEVWVSDLDEPEEQEDGRSFALMHEGTALHEKWPAYLVTDTDGQEHKVAADVVVHATDCELIEPCTDEEHVEALLGFASQIPENLPAEEALKIGTLRTRASRSKEQLEAFYHEVKARQLEAETSALASQGEAFGVHAPEETSEVTGDHEMLVMPPEEVQALTAEASEEEEDQETQDTILPEPGYEERIKESNPTRGSRKKKKS